MQNKRYTNIYYIGSAAFFNCFGLESINIPDTVITIGDGAFSNCSGLTNIVTPDSVTTIGREAFAGCTGLKNITIAESVTSIGDSAFLDCDISFTIYGYLRSFAETYAINNGYTFIAIDTITSISGQVKCYVATVETTVTLYETGTNTIAYTVSLAAVAESGEKTLTYFFEDVADGTYDLVVTNSRHGSCTLNAIETTKAEITPDLITIYFIGDVNRNGSINSTDVLLVRQYIAGLRDKN